MRQVRLSLPLAFAWLAVGIAPVWSASYPDLLRATPGLLVYYPFDDPEAGVLDASGQQHHGAAEGGMRLGVDSGFAALGRAACLDGGHVRVPELGEFPAVSVEMWVKLNAMPRAGVAALYAAEGWQPNFLHLNVKAAGDLEFAVNGVKSYPTTTSQVLVSDQWTHLVATYDAASGSQQIFVNGRRVLEQTASPRPAVKLASAAIGDWLLGAGRPLTADVDEFAVYSRALTVNEVRHRYYAAQGLEAPVVDFAKQIQPLLAHHCLDCHGADLQESQLRLDVRGWALRGGESGEPAYHPFDADSSQLLHRVTTTDSESRMPPEGDALTASEIALLREWIDQGAPWPDELAGDELPEGETASLWSLKPLAKVAPPASDDPFVAQGNAIDAFVYAKLVAKGLKPSPPADRRTLLRRLYLDVHGLPPTPEQVREFVQDASPDAWRKQIERVLSSPRYGERWASHWLDVVRFGDTHGFEVNTPRDHAWPYRDYVIKSLNDDKPYNQFIREQIAGDQLGVDSATGFLVAAPALLPGQIGKDDASLRLARADELHEVVVTVSTGVLGVTVGCARCHNHKFDPITQRDYYQLQAFFTGMRYGDRPIRHPEEVRLPQGAAMPATTIFGGTFTRPDPAYRLYRGDPMQRREHVAPDVPAVFGSLGLSPDASDAQRRQALADWLASADNPLTPRVIANRVWQHHLGLGIVQTPSDFGTMGFKPTHPELLDWLAATLIEQIWSLKSLHRLILESNTYQQSSSPRAEALTLDSNSEWLWRFPPRRLEMEPIRDSILAVSGALDLSMGGPGFMLFKPNDNYVRVYNPKEEWGPGEWRRMIYAHRVRMAQDGVFGAFDCPDAGQPAPKRSSSTTALQALNLLNSTFIKQQADLFAQRVAKEAAPQSAEPIHRLFELALARQPTAEELAAAQAVSQEFGLPAVARALFNTNEFLFIP